MINRNQGIQIRPSSVVLPHSRIINSSPSNNRGGLKFEPPPSRSYRPASYMNSVSFPQKPGKIQAAQNLNNISQQHLAGSLKTHAPIFHFHYFNHEGEYGKKIIMEKESIDKGWEQKYTVLITSMKKMHKIWETIYQEYQEVGEQKKQVDELISTREKNQLNSKHYKQFDHLLACCLDGAFQPSNQANQQTPVTGQSDSKKQHEEYLKQITNLENQNITVIAEYNKLKHAFAKMEKKELEYQDHIEQLQQTIHSKCDELAGMESTIDELTERIQKISAEEGRIKFIYEEQMQNNLQKYQRIEKELKERSQIKEEQLKSNILMIREELNQKQKVIQELKVALSRKQSTSEMQNYYQNKISELTQIAKEKDQKMKQFKETILQQEKKIAEISDNYISQKQLETLHKKIKKYENMLLTQGGTIYNKLNNETYDYFNGKVFEEKVIYELKKDNDKLLKFIGGCGQFRKYTTEAMEQRIYVVQYERDSEGIQKTIKLVEDTLYKLERIIQKHQVDAMITRQTLSRPHSKEKTKKSRSKTYSINSDLSTLKIYLIEVNECAHQALKQFLRKQKKDDRLKLETEREIRKMEEMKLSVQQQEDLAFYKNQNSKLTSRIDSLLDINSKLKEQLLKKSPQAKPQSQIYWKNEAHILEQKIKSLEIKLSKSSEERNKLEEKLVQEENKSILYSAQIERLLFERDKLKIKNKSKQEEKISEYKDIISELTDEKEKLKQELNHEIKKQRESQYKLGQLLREIQDVSEKNKIMDRKIKEAEKLFTRFSELEIKLIQLSQGVSTKYGKQKQCTFLTKLARDQLCNYMQEIYDLIQQIEDNKNSFSIKQIKLNSQLALHTLSSLNVVHQETNVNYKYLIELARGVAIETECLSEELKVEGERNRKIVKQILKNNVMLLKELGKN